jgi:hypothetical protein
MRPKNAWLKLHKPELLEQFKLSDFELHLSSRGMRSSSLHERSGLMAFSSPLWMMRCAARRKASFVQAIEVIE